MFFKKKIELDKIFSESQIKNLDTELSKVIYYALRDFRDKTEDVESQSVEWCSILEKMIWTFKTLAQERENGYDDLDGDTMQELVREHKRISEGLDLFSKYYRNLYIK
jgi:hypothetical protein